MKFFKSFRLLHRRTKSDSDAVLFPPVCTPLRPTHYRNSTSDIGHQQLPHACPQDPFQLYVFPEEPNTAHISLGSLLALEAGLRECKAANLVSAAQIEALKKQVAEKDERIKQLEVIAYAVENQATEIATDVLPTTNSFTIAQPSSFRTNAQYSAAIDLTIRTRAALRENKKYKKFWKRKAQEDGRNGDTITPSASDISSIHEGLTPDRQEALDALRAKRSQMLVSCQRPLSSIVEQERTFAGPNAARFGVKFEPEDAIHVYPISLTTHAALSPLASQSFRREVSKQTAGSKILAFASRDQKVHTRLDASGTDHSDRPLLPTAPPPRKYIRNTYHNSAKVIRAPSSRSSSGTSVTSIFSATSTTSSATTASDAISYSAAGKVKRIASSEIIKKNNDGPLVHPDNGDKWGDKERHTNSKDLFEPLVQSSDDDRLDSPTHPMNTSSGSYVHIKSPAARIMSSVASASPTSARSTTPVALVRATKAGTESLSLKSPPPVTAGGAKMHRRKDSLTKHIGAVTETVTEKAKGSPKKSGNISGGVKTTVSVAQRVKSLQGASPEKKALRPFR